MHQASRDLLEQAKAIAHTLVAIPPHYDTVLEDLVDRATHKEAHLWWRDTKDPDQGMVVVILAMPEGRLLELERFECEEPPVFKGGQPREAVSLDQRRQVAEAFLMTHVPGFQTDFPQLHVEDFKGFTRFAWSQTVAGRPLPDTGLHIDVDTRGRIKAFRFKGKRVRLPSPPAQLRSREEVLQEAKRALNATLMLAHLDPKIYLLPQDGLGETRLVYWIEGLGSLPADGDVPGPAYNVHVSSDKKPKLLPLEASSDPVVLGQEALEAFLEHVSGDLSRYPRRDMDWEGERQVVWLEETYANFISPDLWPTADVLLRPGFPPESPSSPQAKTFAQLFEALFNFRVAKMTICQASGRLLGFVRFCHDNETQRVISAPKCLPPAVLKAKAIAFIQRVFPEAHRYLFLVDDEILDSPPIQEEGLAEASGESPNQIFRFEAFIDGIPLYLFSCFVTLRRTDGRIVAYMSTETHPSIFLATPKTPRITREAAIARVAQELDIRLEWDQIPEGEDNDIALFYRPYFPQGTIRFIDALSGEPIRERHP
ncbi:MAG TPA: hypothetical protein DEA73_03490 [Peptococcaceae bacterium]|nr:hypothetical protein [Peptococcaceae bacterium]